MKNTLQDLNGYLFEELERLNNEELTDEELEKELKRADAVTKVSTQIISNANVVLRAEQFKSEYTNREHNQLNAIVGKID